MRFVEDKIDTVRSWARKLVTEVSEYEGQVSGFRDLLEIELPRAVALLERLIGSLEAYTSVAAVPVTVTLGHEPQSIAHHAGAGSQADDQCLPAAARVHAESGEAAGGRAAAARQASGRDRGGVTSPSGPEAAERDG